MDESHTSECILQNYMIKNNLVAGGCRREDEIGKDISAATTKRDDAWLEGHQIAVLKK